MSRWLIDLRPVRESPAFRRLWVGSTLSLIGSALTTFALPLQVYDLLWLLYVLAAMHAALAAISGPLRRTFIPSLLPAEQLVAGMALNRLSFQLMLTLGPALAGLIAAAPGLGLPGCYLIDAVSFAASLYGLARLPDVPYPQVTRRTLRAVAEGLRFIRRSDRLAAPLLADLIATVFGLPVALFPAINAQRFDGDPRTLGLFATAIGVGGLLTAVLSGSLHSVARQGSAMLVSVAVWGAALAGFAVAPGLGLTLAMLAIAGAADSITVVLRGTIIQAHTPDELRGRITTVEHVAGVSGGQLGNLEAGALGAITTPSASALIGGLLTIIGTVTLAINLPDFVRQHAPAPDLANARQP